MNSAELFIVAVLTVMVKSGVIVWILCTVANRLHPQREVRPYLNIPVSLLVCAALTSPRDISRFFTK